MSLQADIEARDGESLAEKVDFPSVRVSLKDQMNVMLTKQMASSSNDDPWGPREPLSVRHSQALW